MADVLQQLRAALSAQQRVVVDEAQRRLLFPDGSSHPIATPCSYRQSRGQGEPYTIGAVWFYCSNPKLPLGQYRTEARPYGLVARIDQKDMLDYVTGETDSSVAVKEAETIFDAVDTRDAKRARLDDDGAAGDKDAEAEAAAAAAAIEVEEDFLPNCVTVEDILGRERSLSTRNSILLAPDPKHFSSVESLYAATKKKRETNKRRPSAKAKSNREVERDVDRLRLGAKDGYYANRTEQNADAAMRNRVGGDVDINFGGTAASWTSSGSKSSKKDGGGKSAGGTSKSSDDVADSGPAPIIIVPMDARGALTMFNAKDLLERGRFKTTAEAKAAGARRERRVTLNRTLRGGAVKKYEIVDSARALSKSDWSRVVAVFVSSGKLYQFNGWPKDVATPVQIFSKYAGFNVRFSDEIPDPVIKSWKVHTYDISKNPDKRYLDLAVTTGIWAEIDTVVARRKK